MKILFYTDNHFCENSSIVNKSGTKYSVRLENQILSLNWAEEQAIKNNCEVIVCLGDFFDKAMLNEQEITAAKDIKWANMPHYFIVGNHESSSSDLQFSSTNMLKGENRFIISEPCQMSFDSNCIFNFLPYVLESDRLPINKYFSKQSAKYTVILSHNDLKGIQMGPVMSQQGFTLDDIEANCDLFLNGHLHNGTKVSEKVINLGNLTGKDFGENALKYKHEIFIFDTETHSLTSMENPYALNFYKLEINSKADIEKLNNLKDWAVLSVKCSAELISEVRELLERLTLVQKVIAYKLVIIRDTQDTSADYNIADLTVDHLAEFVKCCREKINNSAVLDEELSKVCK